MSIYPKISSPWKRHTEGEKRNKFDFTRFSSPEIEALWDVSGWTFTEKLDGTNVRVEWDGYRPTFKGRTDNAQMPTFLLTHLQDTFTEELLEQQFEVSSGEATFVTLYGEGVGPKIQKNGDRYYSNSTFVLFDVRVGKWWLQYDAVVDIAAKLSVPVVQRYAFDCCDGAESAVWEGLPSFYGDFYAEGTVGTAPHGLLSRSGNRIQVKLKHTDLYREEGRG